MTETPETATTTDLALDDGVPLDIELSSNDIEFSSDIPVEIDLDVDFEGLSVDFELTTGCEYWSDGIFVLATVPDPSSDADMPVTPDPV